MDPYFSVIGKLQGIAHQVYQDLSQALRIAHHPGWQCRLDRRMQLQAFLLRSQSQQAQRL